MVTPTLTRHRSDRKQPEHDCDGPDCAELFSRYQASRSRTRRNHLVVVHQWLSDRCARRFAGRGESGDDLAQVASIGLIKAIERFDPDHGVGFPVFGTPTITGEIKRYFRDSTWRLKVPRGPKEQRSKIVAAVDTLHQRLGRSPTSDEVAAYLELDHDTVVEALVANSAYRADSLDSEAAPVEGRHYAVGPSDEVTDVDIRMATMNALCERERQIIYWRFYEDWTQREIGEHLGVGQVQVSRLLRRSLDQLRPHLGSEPVGSPQPV